MIYNIGDMNASTKIVEVQSNYPITTNQTEWRKREIVRQGQIIAILSGPATFTGYVSPARQQPRRRPEVWTSQLEFLFCRSPFFDRFRQSE